MEIRTLFVFALSAGCGFAAVIGASTAPDAVTAERIAALPRPEQSAWQDYLARSIEQIKKDHAVLDAELKATGLKVMLVPPSGSAAKSLLLDKPGEWYTGAEAKKIADIMLSFQTPAGGWSKNLDMTSHARRAAESFAGNNLAPVPSGPGDLDTPRDPQWHYVGTIDNDATTTEIQFLARMVLADPGATKYREAILRGVDYLLASQYPNGGWPQIWPLEGGYHDAVTFNDGAITETLEVLQDVADGKGGFAFVSQAVRRRAADSVTRGIAIIVKTQISGAAWAQQYDALNLKPVAARNYEPIAVSGGESSALALFLMRQPKPTASVINAVYIAVDWFRKTAVYGFAFEKGDDGRKLRAAPGAGPIWARYYEIGSNRPIFGDRDKSIHDDVNEISLERRNGYSWYNGAPTAALDRFAEWSAAHPRGK